MNTTYNTAGKSIILAFLFLFNSCSANDENNKVTDKKEIAISNNIKETNENLPEIIGTSWSLLCIYEKGTQPKNLFNFPEYLFCKNGNFEFHTLTSSIGQMGTYTIKGNQLVMVSDGSDKLTEKYTITWNATEKYLELNDGKLIFRLRYLTKTKC